MDFNLIIEKMKNTIGKLPFSKMCENSSVSILKDAAPFANYVVAVIGVVFVFHIITAPLSRKSSKSEKSTQTVSKTVPDKKVKENKKNILTSNDGSITCNLIGTWVCRSGNTTETFIFRADGTFTYNCDVEYEGPSQLGVGKNGEITSKKGWGAGGNWALIDGNILHREYTTCWSNIKGAPAKGSSTNRELRPINENEFLIGGSVTFRRQ